MASEIVCVHCHQPQAAHRHNVGWPDALVCPTANALIDKRSTGLYHKFNVQRTDGTSVPGGKHFNCRYFVLDLTHDPYAGPALAAYADSCEAHYPLLARDLRDQRGATWQAPQEANQQTMENNPARVDSYKLPHPGTWQASPSNSLPTDEHGLPVQGPWETTPKEVMSSDHTTTVVESAAAGAQHPDENTAGSAPMTADERIVSLRRQLSRAYAQLETADVALAEERHLHEVAYAAQGQELLHHIRVTEAADAALAIARQERDEARYCARVLAHAWKNDARPPDAIVSIATNYPKDAQQGPDVLSLRAELIQMTRERDEASARLTLLTAEWTDMVGRLKAADAALATLRQELQESFALCADHQPSVWEGSGTCVICEAVEEHTQLAAMTRARDEALSQIPTEPPNPQDGCFLLNAYGRRCFEKGRQQAETELATLRTALTQLVAQWREEWKDGGGPHARITARVQRDCADDLDRFLKPHDADPETAP